MPTLIPSGDGSIRRPSGNISARHCGIILRWADQYPHYIFNFSGANRYRLMKEYYPADFARLKQYVAAGRWYPAGSSMEEGDVNSPSAEAIIRQVLYGNNWF